MPTLTVREHLGTIVERQKEVYDLKVHVKAFEIGDLVTWCGCTTRLWVEEWQRNYTVHGVDRLQS